MKCTSCGGRLEGTMAFCPFCGVRQEVDLRQIHFRDLGDRRIDLPARSCTSPLGVIEFETEPRIPDRALQRRATACFSIPGNWKRLLDAQTHPLVWLDPVQMQQIGEDFGFSHEVVYRKCPMCGDRMNHRELRPPQWRHPRPLRHSWSLGGRR